MTNEFITAEGKRFHAVRPTAPIQPPLTRSGKYSIAVVTLAVALLLAAAGQAQDSAATQAARLVLRWTIVVSDTFEQSRAFKSDAVDGLVDQFLAGGAVRAIEDRISEDAVKAADRIVTRFTLAMISGGERRDDGSRDVTEASFNTGVRAVCPGYPFC